MVVMGAPKVIFIPGGHSEQGECQTLTSVMLPMHSPASPESASSDVPPRKRQRLTHLSQEEKALRRKLKNRVAAQTARDRKKARMGELEQQVLDLELENEKLLIENKLLREKSHGLITENQELRQRLGLDALDVKEEEEIQVMVQSREDEVSPVIGSAESAALRLRAPLQQEQAQMSPNLTTSAWILTALVLQTVSLISCLAYWKAWTRRYYLASKENCPGTSSKRLAMKQIPYPPPHLLLWGPHQSSWKPLMN
ncbi:PREDICTED: X-box-binding protein 1 isoform X2 [Nanorana parkeri]|uniref:X-box-binding protein 1 isoform X2 n=1 Tax=Nanorana parkeri TaxID=125878 RepID=UPI00085484CF|nr:PREDICTED: X-box-binding protein 1 isoform X2 [Nanorana parkeri]